MRDLPAARMGHRPALDGLRALAVLAVVAVHYAGEHRWLVRGGGLGVNAFFVLSGFLITRLMLEELAGHRRVDIASFYRRRFARLAPAFVLFVVAVLLVEGTTDIYGDSGSVLRGAVTSTLYIHNWAGVAGWSDPAFGITWSLAVEEQFYLVWPAVFIVTAGRFGRRGIVWVSGGIALVAATETAFRSIVLDHSAEVLKLGTDSNGLIGLMAGCWLAAVVDLDVDERHQRLLRVAFIPAASLVVVSVLVLDGSSDVMPRGGTLLFSALMVVVVLAVVSGAVRPGPLGWPVLQWIGRASYGIYLFHLLALRAAYEVVPGDPLVARLLGIVLTLAVCAASLRWVERPLRRRLTSGHGHRRPEPRPARALAGVAAG